MHVARGCCPTYRERRVGENEDCNLVMGGGERKDEETRRGNATRLLLSGMADNQPAPLKLILR